MLARSTVQELKEDRKRKDNAEGKLGPNWNRPHGGAFQIGKWRTVLLGREKEVDRSGWNAGRAHKTF
jgi:hypothetical protein